MRLQELKMQQHEFSFASGKADFTSLILRAKTGALC
jgi:hypothetical protein